MRVSVHSAFGRLPSAYHFALAPLTPAGRSGRFVPAQVLFILSEESTFAVATCTRPSKSAGAKHASLTVACPDRPPFRQIRPLRCLGQGCCFALSFVIYYQPSALST